MDKHADQIAAIRQLLANAETCLARAQAGQPLDPAAQGDRLASAAWRLADAGGLLRELMADMRRDACGISYRTGRGYMLPERNDL